MSDRTEEIGQHPVLDGRPILLGDWLHATDPECNGPDGQTFTMEGQVRHVYSDYGGAVVVLAPTSGLAEEFYVHSTVLRRIAPTQSGSTEGVSDGR